MSKLKIEHGVSRVRRAKLQASIDQSIADDIQVMSEWSNNEPQYVINQLLRFALAQEDDFQRYKASAAKTAGGTKVPSSSARTAQDAVARTDAPAPVRS